MTTNGLIGSRPGARGRLFDDIHVADRIMRERHAVDLTADASGTGRITSAPAEAATGEEFRYSSPNRGASDGTMRSRRYRRSR